MPLTPPAAPTNLTAVANNGSVALTWTAPQGAVSYRISRSTTSGSGYGLVAISSTASFTDATVVNGTTYYYVVTASNGTCNSGNSAEVPATPKCTPPSVPTNVRRWPNRARVDCLYRRRDFVPGSAQHESRRSVYPRCHANQHGLHGHQCQQWRDLLLRCQRQQRVLQLR